MSLQYSIDGVKIAERFECDECMERCEYDEDSWRWFVKIRKKIYCTGYQYAGSREMCLEESEL